jgi:hypothetical protein
MIAMRIVSLRVLAADQRQTFATPDDAIGAYQLTSGRVRGAF